MISNSKHESNTAYMIFKTSIDIAAYYKGVAEALVSTPTHRFFWWRVRLMLRFAEWIADRITNTLEHFPGARL